MPFARARPVPLPYLPVPVPVSVSVPVPVPVSVPVPVPAAALTGGFDPHPVATIAAATATTHHPLIREGRIDMPATYQRPAIHDESQHPSERASRARTMEATSQAGACRAHVEPRHGHCDGWPPQRGRGASAHPPGSEES